MLTFEFLIPCSQLGFDEPVSRRYGMMHTYNGQSVNGCWSAAGVEGGSSTAPTDAAQYPNFPSSQNGSVDQIETERATKVQQTENVRVKRHATARHLETKTYMSDLEKKRQQHVQKRMVCIHQHKDDDGITNNRG